MSDAHTRTTERAVDQAHVVADVAGERTKEVVSTAGDQVQQVAETAREQVAQVASSASSEAGRVLGQVKGHLQGQAGAQTAQVAQAIDGLAGNFRALADGRPAEAGALADVAREAAWRAGQLATRVNARGFDGVVYDLKGFARRRPLVFLSGALFAGFLTGRLVRAAQQSGALGPAVSGHGPPPPGPGTNSEVRVLTPQPAALNATFPETFHIPSGSAIEQPVGEYDPYDRVGPGSDAYRMVTPGDTL